MEAKKVNSALYLKIKEVVESGDYTVDEAAIALDWVHAEYIRKASRATRAIKVNEIKHLEDVYD